MSEKKVKKIHVDKLIVTADEVIITPARRPGRRDPWGFPLRAEMDEETRAEEDNKDGADDEMSEEEMETRRRRGPWL